MAKTINRIPNSVDAPKIDYQFFNHNQWKGMNTNKNFLSVDQETFADTNNVYVTDVGLLRSRPSIKRFGELVLNNIINMWTFPNVDIFLTFNEDKYELHFIRNILESSLIIEIKTDNIKLVLCDKKIFVFCPDNLYYYDNSVDVEDRWFEASNLIYIPVTKRYIDGVIKEGESENILTTSHYIEYIFSSLDDAKIGILNHKTLSIVVDNKTYEINFNRNTKYTIVEKFSYLLDDCVIGYSAESTLTNSVIRRPIISVSKTMGNMIMPVRDKESGRITSILYSPDGRSYESHTLPKMNLLASPVISDDGMFMAIVSVNGVFVKSVLIDSSETLLYPDWHKLEVFDEINASNITPFMSNRFTSIAARDHDHIVITYCEHEYNGVDWSDYDVYDENINEIPLCMNAVIHKSWSKNIDKIPLNYKTISLFSVNDANNPIYISDEDFGINIIGKSNKLSSGNFDVYFTISDKLDNSIKTDVLINNFEVNSTEFVIYETNGVKIMLRRFENDDNIYLLLPYDFVLLNVDLDELTTHVYACSSILKIIPTRDEYGVSLSYTVPTIKFTHIDEDDNAHFDMSYFSKSYINLGTDKIFTEAFSMLAIDLGIDTFMNKHVLVYKNDKDIRRLIHTYEYNNTVSKIDKFISENVSDNHTFKIFEDRIIVSNKLYHRDLISTTLYYEMTPIFVDENTLLLYEFDGTNYILYGNSNEATFKEFVQGENKYLVPQYVCELEDYLFSVENNLYISQYPDTENFQWYFPKYKHEWFDDKITNLHPISKSEIAIFFVNNIYYVTKSENVYYYTKSKLGVGCNDGSDVLTTFDGTAVIFSSSRGLVALSYQDFIASNEQSLTYLSDLISERYKLFNTGQIKLHMYEHWIIIYKPNYEKSFVFDIRNSSWWPITTNGKISKILTMFDRLILLDNKKLSKLDTNDNNYEDYYGKISWYILSQKLHLNAVNYNKHIISFTLASVNDNPNPCNIKLNVSNYRKRLDAGKEEIIYYEIDVIRTFVKRVNYAKVAEFQYKLSSNLSTAIQVPLSLSNISIKYNVTGALR